MVGDHAKAWTLYSNFQSRLVKKYNSTIPLILDEFWDTFVLDNIWMSRAIAALPPKEDYAIMEQTGLENLKRSRMVRSTEWLRQHGVCADHFHMKVSTLPRAGHGAFASQLLPKNTVVLPVPVLPIPIRNIFNMYELIHGNRTVDRKKLAGQQLMVNYCLGHAESTMLLSPYGPVFPLINHNQSLANVRLQWASPERSNHHPEWLEKNVSFFEDQTTASIALELVTTRDIEPGQEIFLDYGDDWEKAWQEHVRNWKPVEGAEIYQSAESFNQDPSPLRTEFEQLKAPYPGNVGIKFDEAFRDRKAWKLAEKMGRLEMWKEDSQGAYVNCEILRYKETNGTFYYTIATQEKKEHEKAVLIKDLPREAFVFEDRPYTSDLFLPNAFRHDIRIPDDLFPAAWKNLNTEQK